MKRAYREDGFVFDRTYLQRKRRMHEQRARVVAIQKASLTAAVVCMVLAATILLGGLHQRATASETGARATECFANVTVSSGDTLWKIASDYTNGSEAAISSCVEEIRSLNSLGLYEAIRPGDKLIVPYYVYRD